MSATDTKDIETIAASQVSESGNRYFIINKPYNILSQFIGDAEVRMLGQLDFQFPEGSHAIGRLDAHSEGLLIVTTNKRVTKLLFQSKVPHKRTYLVKVRNRVSQENLQRLRDGVQLRIDNNELWTTTPCDVQIVEKPANLFSHPFETKEYGEYTWMTLTLTEGKFHQVRKMTEAIRHRCVRLIRLSIEDLELGDLQPGGVREIEEERFFELLKIDGWRK